MINNLKKLLTGFFITAGLLVVTHTYVQGQIITTLAGNGFGQGTGTGGFSGDGGAATSAELNFPWGVAVDDSGNAYIADEYNNRIRKVNGHTGIITTFAGTGTSGFSGDSGQATAAELYYPTAVAVDTSGNLYIADRLNNRIREVIKKTGIIYTIAGSKYIIGGKGFTGDGGPATACNLDQPFGVAIDDSGNVYIVDYANDRIRKVSIATGFINTIAGNGKAGFSGDNGLADSAELNYPLGIAVDDSENIYIGDYINNRIRKINQSTHIIKSIAGNGGQGYYGDNGPATDANFYHTEGVAVDDSGNVYVADFYNNVIRKINQSTGIITTFAGDGYGAGAGYGGSSGDGGPATDAEIYFPVGVGVDAYGNVYIADNYNNRIRKVFICPQPLVMKPPSVTDCSGQDVMLTVGGGANYTWSPSLGLNTTEGDTIIAAPVTTVTYTVTGTVSDGCSGVGSVVVTVIASPNKPTFRQHGDTLISSSTYNNQWYRNDTLLKNDTSHQLIITALGKYWVIVNNEANGCSSSSDSMNITEITAIDRLSIISEQLSIYPNPFTNDIFIKINSSAEQVQDWSMQITDVLGRTVYTGPSINYINNIDLSNLTTGVYFVTVINKASRVVVPVIKQN